MTDTSQPDERAGDYSYDLVHEELQRMHDEAGRAARSSPHPVTTQTPEDTGGDYSYDLAHDIPGRDA